jgi:hypothetical protein
MLVFEIHRLDSEFSSPMLVGIEPLSEGKERRYKVSSNDNWNTDGGIVIDSKLMLLSSK